MIFVNLGIPYLAYFDPKKYTKLKTQILFFLSFMLKLRQCGKATKFEKNLHLVLTFTQKRQNKWEIFCKFLWPFQKT
jgi:hypothetical protein